MKQKLLLLAVALTACVVATAVFATSRKYVVEAEKYIQITPGMQKATSEVASGGAYVEVPLKRPHATKEGEPADTGRAVYNVYIQAAGTYRFWGRCNWYDGCGNSFFVKIGDKPPVVLGQDGTYQRWHWVKGPQMALPVGWVQIIIQNREDGAKIDQFMLTSDLEYVPVRAEHATQ